MKQNSSLFDHIRIKPDPERDKAKQGGPRCEWEGCDKPGGHKAPKGRGKEGQFHSFCTAHVREYNKNYNYFAGMGDSDLSAYQKESLYGHRPTKPMGARPGAATRQAKAGMGKGFRDPHRLFQEQLEGEAQRKAEARAKRRVHNAEAKCLSTLHLDEHATSDEIKARYKELVKKHHPDVNGGSRESEDRLHEIIQAYKHLKSVGLC